MLLGLARPVLDGVEGLEAALGARAFQRSDWYAWDVTVTASRFLVQRLPTLLSGHPGLKVEATSISDRFGDMIEDRLDLAMRVGAIADSSLVIRTKLDRGARCGAAPELYRTARHTLSAC